MAAIFALAMVFSFLSVLVWMFQQGMSIYWWTPRRIKKYMEKQGVRGPKPSFLVGNLFDMASLLDKTTSSDMPYLTHDIVSRLLPHYILWSKLYGERFIFWWGVEPRMCISETEMIKELLSSKNSLVYGKSAFQKQGSKHFIGKGLLMANGDEWFHQRHIVAPAFQADKLKRHVGYMIECTNRTIQALHGAAKAGEEDVEICGYLCRLTADIISRTEFDSCYEKGKQIFELLTSLQLLSSKASRHLWFPGSRFFPSKFNREIKSLKGEVEKLLLEIIESRRDCMEIGRSASYGNDLLGLLLAETEKKYKKGESDDGFCFTTQHLMDECKTFFFTGHETTALLLTWTIMLLASNPGWQERAKAEVEQVCGGSAPAVDHLPKLSLAYGHDIGVPDEHGIQTVKGSPFTAFVVTIRGISPQGMRAVFIRARFEISRLLSLSGLREDNLQRAAANGNVDLCTKLLA
ncbi:cytokinin hydroxylase [Amborella trichopoda]|uniref:cytokinin hydroxylase n=1 Tax=Amborella trichopoda TaxID=13333 RepID=UPI0009C00042|nr:cytokinin hydroxylase [Amborella trichopoda]|eukprot:XP_011624255.2 cytokinin hydroxylase [Amborella trichopoda]